MNDLNRVILIGRLVRDAELKYTNTGTPIINFSIAINEQYNFNGNKKEYVNYFDIVLWGKIAESLNQYLSKGKQIAISGKLRQERWTQDGKNRTKVKIIADTIQLLGFSKQNTNQKNENDDKFEDDIF